jgi:hypothetical protein
MSATELARPRDNSSAAIREAIGALRQDRAAAEQQIAFEAGRRAELLLTRTDRTVVASEQAIAAARLTVERTDLMIGALTEQLDVALAREAGEQRDRRIDEARRAIEAFNDWLTQRYEMHANEIARGVQLERDARTRMAGLDPSKLPAIAWTFVGSERASLGHLARLPATKPGLAIVWPRVT